MRRAIMVLAGLLSATGAAHADSRFFCSADDKDVRFTIESGFQETGGHKLNHFRGAILLKDATVSELFSRYVFESSDLTHHWSHNGELRLEVFDNGSDETSKETLNLVILAGERGKTPEAFSGTYELAVRGSAKPLSANGKVSCGSAGTYNIMQPEISALLKARKVKNIEATKADVIATGNIGCITQIATGTGIPILHTVQLLDWAYGGDVPQKLRDLPLD